MRVGNKARQSGKRSDSGDKRRTEEREGRQEKRNLHRGKHAFSFICCPFSDPFSSFKKVIFSSYKLRFSVQSLLIYNLVVLDFP